MLSEALVLCTARRGPGGYQGEAPTLAAPHLSFVALVLLLHDFVVSSLLQVLPRSFLLLESFPGERRRRRELLVSTGRACRA